MGKHGNKWNKGNTAVDAAVCNPNGPFSIQGAGCECCQPLVLIVLAVSWAYLFTCLFHFKDKATERERKK